jgi:hypothetical protein
MISRLESKMVSMVMISRGRMPTGEKFLQVFNELNSATDRAAAIVGGSIVELALQSALEAQLHRDEKLTDSLFRPSGAFGAFATKINLGFLVGIYGQNGRKELTIIKNIRNAFAHRLDIDGFDDMAIRDEVLNLTFGDRYAIDVKQQPPQNRDPSLPIGDWPWWFSVMNKDEALKSPRQRFLMSVSAMTYGLSLPHQVAMPQPHF